MAQESHPQGIVQYVQSLENRIVRLEENLAASRADQQSTERQLEELRALLPNSSIISHSFLRRAFTVWGHVLVAQLMIAIPIYCLVFAVTLGLD